MWCWDLVEHVRCRLWNVDSSLVFPLNRRLVFVHCGWWWHASPLWSSQWACRTASFAISTQWPLQLISELVQILLLVLVDNIQDREWLFTIWWIFSFVFPSPWLALVGLLLTMLATWWFGPTYILLSWRRSWFLNLVKLHVKSCRCWSHFNPVLSFQIWWRIV